MLFNSYEFIFCFLPIVLTGCLILARYFQRKYIIVWLVVSSFFFYAWWNPPFFFLIFISILCNYIFAGCLLSHHKKWVLWVGLSFNLGVLIYYKYIGFFTDIFETSHGKDFFVFNTILPLGISFFTFQQIAFLVDVYREKFKYNFVNHCMFIVFFPQLIAGPIVLHGEMVPQFKEKKISIRSRNLAIGICYFTLGLIKKVIIADRLSLYATPVFEAAAFEPISFLVSWCGVLAYSFQIYFDFSGYSDMAIGLGQMFGIKLPLNFNSPYKSTNIIDFWRRWHMTLSRFLRDYLYIPLGGERVGTFRRYYNLMVVMLLGGLWHGAGITFILWGGLHGIYLIVNHLWRYLVKGLNINDSAVYYRFLSWVLTFLAVTIAWCFFRAVKWTPKSRQKSAEFKLHI